MTPQLHTPEAAACWLHGLVTGGLYADSRKAGEGDGFIAWPGAVTDGRHYVRAARAAGVRACLVEHAGADAFGFSDTGVATYKGLKAATGPIAAAYFEAPSKQLHVTAITGTNGKTSTAWWLAQALGRLDRKCGIVGTLGIGEPGNLEYSGLTTPDPVLLQQALRRFVDNGFAACALEASSIGIAEGRLDGTCVKLAIFTNFTQDHLDYHASMQDYWHAKARLFGWAGLQAAVVNIDDAKGRELYDALAPTELDVWTFACDAPARLRAEAIDQRADSISFDVIEGAERHRLRVRMVGVYNVSNVLGVMAALRATGVSLVDAVRVCGDLPPVPGRAETLSVPGRSLVVIDYAHTPDALEKVLAALKPLALRRGGRLWCVFGCGGDRDAGKRPLMAAAAEKSAERLVVTSDNPRHEDPMAIIDQVLRGLLKPHAAHVQPDRAAAIRYALGLAQPNDVVLLAGKGHEIHQEIAGVKLVFSDRQHAEAALAETQANRGEPETTA